MPDAIVVEGLGKRFRRYHSHRPTTLKQALLMGFRGLKPADTFWALQDVSFRIAPGSMVGAIGANGAGKSTLLRLIGGVGRPDRGKIVVNGKVGALLDLGAGFHPDLTGRENVFINGVIAGLTRQEVAARFDDIVDFAELETFIDSPLRTYSTGMQLRLGFAVAAHTDPEILLIDEVLAVGDMAFQQKCLDRIAEFKAGGCTIVLVSHDVQAIQRLCDQVIWLKKGKLRAFGAPDVVVGQYVAEMSTETRRRTPAERPTVHTSSGTELKVNENRFGSLEMELTAVRLLTAAGVPTTELGSGDSLRVVIDYAAPTAIASPIFGVTLIRDDGTVCYDTSTETVDLPSNTVQGEGQIVFQFDRLDLIGGQYYVDVGVYEREWAYAYDYHWRAYPLSIRSTNGENGIVRPPHRWIMDVAGE